MGYKLEITGEADEEIFEAYVWYEQQTQGLGDRFIEQLETVFQKITLNPHHYKIVSSVFRQASVRSFPYVVYFEEANNKIIVYSVFHTSRKPRN